MAMPGPFGVEFDELRRPDHARGLEGRADAAGRLATATGLPAFVAVDTRRRRAWRAALRHRRSDFRDFYYLYFGVGLGGSMVHDGAALRGAWGNAGEIGHMPVVPHGDALPLRQSRLPRALPVARGAERRSAGDRRGRLARRGRAAASRSAPSSPSRTSSTPRRSCSAGSRRRAPAAAGPAPADAAAEFDRRAARPDRARG